MNDIIDIGYSLDASGYTAGVQTVEQANRRLYASQQQVERQQTLLQRAMSTVTPARAAGAGVVAATTQAAAMEKQYASLEARTISSGESFGKMRGEIRALARDVPIGQQGGRDIVKQISEIGVAGAGSESRIADLSKSVADLAGATGEGPSKTAKSLAELATVTGNRNLDPERFRALSDSVTTTSAQMGAGANSTMEYARSLAPMAKEAGIGATAVTGMGAAFSSMGEQGMGAANTVQTMLAGVNKALRDGGPELQNYADIAGMTVERFQALAQSDPSRAVSIMASNTATSGAAGQRRLERIGIEGVSGQQQMQQLSAGGRLDEAIAKANASYGSGSTEEAADAAYSGLANELTRTKEASGQLAEALGRPLLAPLSELAKMVGGITGALGKVLGSGPGQTLLTAGAGLGVAGWAASRLAGPVTAYAAGRQMLTSGPARSLAAGWALQRGLDPSSSRIARFGQPMMRHYDSNSILRDADGNIIRGNQAIHPETGEVMRTGVSRSDATGYSRMNENMMIYGMGAAERAPDERPGRRGTGAGRVSVNRALGAALLGANVSANMTRLGIRDAMEPDPYKRTSGFAAYGGQQNINAVNAAAQARTAAQESGQGRLRSAWAGAGAYVRAQDPEFGRQQQSGFSLRRANAQAAVARLGPEASSAAQMSAAAKGFTQSLDGASKRANYFGQTLSTIARAGGATLAAPVRDAGRLGRGAGAALGGAAMGMLGGPAGLAIMGVMAAGALGVNAYQNRQEEKEYFRGYGEKDIYASINKYRESMGLAAETKTTEDVNREIQNELADAARVRGWDSTLEVTEEDKTAAAKSGKKTLVNYSGSPKQVAAQISAANQQGLTPEELSGIKSDLLTQYDPDTVSKIMNEIPSSLQRGSTPMSSAEYIEDQRTALRGRAGDTRDSRGGWSTRLEKEDKESYDSLVKGITQRAEASDGSAEFITEQRVRESNALLEEALKSRDEQAFDYISKAVGSEFDPEGLGDKNWSYSRYRRMYDRGERDFVGEMANDSDTLQEQLDRVESAGGEVDPNKDAGIKYNARNSPAIKGIREESWLLSDIMSAEGPKEPFGARREAWAAMRDAVEAGPDDVQARQLSETKTIAAAQDAGTSLEELGNKALDASRKVSQSGDEYARLTSLAARSREQEDVELSVAGDPNESRRARVRRYSEDAAREARTPEEEEEQKQARQGLKAEAESAAEYMRNRLQMQYDFDKQVERSTRDFNKSRYRQHEDFNRSVYRAQRDFNIQRERQNRDYNISVTRAERDFGIQRGRAVEQFNISIQRAERDYNRQRERAVIQQGITEFRARRDYNLQVARAEQDFRIQESRAREDFRIQEGRAEQDFRIQMGRQTEDFTLQMARATEDFGISTSRALRDFGINLERQLEDAAKNVFDPYSRVQAKPTWDAQTLAGNLQEQREMMEEQTAGLEKLRRGGLSEDVIRNLGLGEFENAQQVQNLVADMSPQTIERLNREMKDRSRASRELFQDESNTMLKRAREDLNRTMSDQRDDFNRSMERGRDDFNKAMSRSAQDFNRSMSRSRSDFNRSMSRSAQDFRRSMSRSARDFRVSMADMRADFSRSMKWQAQDFRISLADQRQDFRRSMRWQRQDFNRSMRDQAEDFNRSMRDQGKDFTRALNDQRADFNRSQSRQMRDFRTQMSDMRRDIKDADKVISADMTTLAEQTQRAIAGKTVKYSKIMTDGTDEMARDLKKDIVPKLLDAYADIGISKSEVRAGSKASGTRSNETRAKIGSRTTGGPQAFGDGGSVLGSSSHEKADNIPAWVTAGEYIQPVKSVRQYGVDAMESIRRGAATVIDETGRIYGDMQAMEKNLTNMGTHTARNPGAMGGPEWGRDGLPMFNRGGYIYPHMVNWIRSTVPGVGISSTKRNWGTGSYHDVGKAIDIVGSGAVMKRAAQAIMQHFGSTIAELIHNPGFSVKSGKKVPPSFWGASTWAAHGPKNWHVHWAMDRWSGARGGSLGFGGGAGMGMGPDLDELFKNIDKKRKDQHKIYGVLADQAKDVISASLEKNFMGDPGNINYSPGAGVKQWEKHVRRALWMLGQSPALTPRVLMQMNSESSGNPRAINNWDSNARRGTPSKGLMQVIDPTFRAYAHPDYNKNIWDPMSNILASMRYAISRYGSLTRAYRGVGYDDGGVINPGKTLVNNESGKPEALLSNKQWADISSMAEVANQVLSRSDMRDMTATRAAPMVVHNNQTYSYDNRNDFAGAKITVVSQDPDEMARKLEDREVRSRLTRTRGVRTRSHS